MTDLRKAAEMALEALENPWKAKPEGVADAIQALRQALRQALAQPEQKPVAYLDEGLGAFYWPNDCNKYVGFTPLYAVPPHRWSSVTDEELMHEVRRRGFVIRDAQIGREWAGLTDEEIDEGQRQSWVEKQAFESAVWWAEAKLKEKNT